MGRAPTHVYFADDAPGPYDDPEGPSLIADVLLATRRDEDGHAEAVEPLRRAYPNAAGKLTRQVTNTTSGDVAGLFGPLELPE